MSEERYDELSERIQQIEAQLGTLVDALNDSVKVTIVYPNGRKRQADLSEIVEDAKRKTNSQIAQRSTKYANELG